MVLFWAIEHDTSFSGSKQRCEKSCAPRFSIPASQTKKFDCSEEDGGSHTATSGAAPISRMWRNCLERCEAEREAD